LSRVIGILVGSFNPAHAGHLHISQHAKRLLGLDRVIWLVAYHHPFKRDQAAFAERYQSACRYARFSWIGISDFEYRHQTTSSFATLSLWRRVYPHQRFVFLIGADAFCDLDRWYRAQDMLRLAPIAIAPRAGYDARHTRLAAQWADHILPPDALHSLARRQAPCLGFLPMPQRNISSTQHRA